MSDSDKTQTSEIQAHKSSDVREVLREAIDHLEHVLPAQAPIKDFVHHNTLHSFQHLPFPQALSEARKVTGAYGYLPEAQFRRLYAEGRIDNEDLETVLLEDEHLNAADSITNFDERPLRCLDVYKAAMLYPLTAVTNTQLNWQIEECHALQTFQDDVSADSRERLSQTAKNNGLTNEAAAIGDLWAACLETLGLEHFVVHPEDLLDLGKEQAEQIFSVLAATSEEQSSDKPMLRRLVRKEAERTLQQLIDLVGVEITLGGFLRNLTGLDSVLDIQPNLIRHISNYLDHGLAAWHNLDRNDGFYSAWRKNAAHDLAWDFDNFTEAEEELSNLPEDSVDAVIAELQHLSLPRNRWPQYIERLALELPGWSGMFLWRHNHPNYEDLAPHKVDMMDYIAVRLVYERITAQRLCREHWHLEPSLDVLQAYFRRHRSEFMVRYLLFNGRLPEYLTNLGQRLVSRRAPYQANYHEWISLADAIWTWRHSPGADRPVGYSVYRSGWRLFRLAQHLGLGGNVIRALDKPQIDQIFTCLDALSDERVGYLWLQAYEHHYRERLLNALANNKGRGRWKTRESRPAAQIVFCMDDREESIRRHLEEINPNIETLGAAGFFGMAINWRGLDDEKITPLCPIVVTPAHEVREQPRAKQQSVKTAHDKRRHGRLKIKNLLHQEARRNLISSALLIGTFAPLYLLVLTMKVFAPRLFGNAAAKLRDWIDITVPTQVAVNAADPNKPASPESPRLGFNDDEQTDRVENFLRSVGITNGFANFVVMMGHGSYSQNNPHLAAYDCGACSGRHGGPNARVFATIANRPKIRQRLHARGITIPEDTWFLGAEHNTCDDSIQWYDQDVVPEPLQENLIQLKQQLQQSSELSAHERCRRFASAPQKPSPVQALIHTINRTYDFSQARPELGHATNAAAIIGRRSLSQGAFFDRRVFLISYDPSTDAEGKIVEAILLAAGPVGAGISLEYYFSTVNNERYGCSSKVTHNVTGLFGVMEGTSSDLRTGLPKQMIEIHEAMRLQIIVEASTKVLTEIYQRQPLLQELIGNAWVHLIAIDPTSGDMYLFKPEEGFVTWQVKFSELAIVKRSSDWYTGHSEPLPFALIDNGAGA